MEQKKISEFLTKHNLSVTKTDLIELAFIHKSFGNESRLNRPLRFRDNERLEFLGDAVLDLIITKILLDTYPKLSEGELSPLRAALVNEKYLSDIARKLEMQDYLFLGKGEELTQGRNKDSILSGAFEALVAALYEELSFDVVYNWVHDLFKSSIDGVKQHTQETFTKDFKTLFQESVQAKFRTTPKYQLIETKGPDHEKIFEVAVFVKSQEYGRAFGKNKKEAEQNAAQAALVTLQEKAKSGN